MRTPAKTSAEERLRIGGFTVRKTNSPELAERLLLNLRCGEQVALFFANTNFVVKCRALRPQLDDESVLIVNDGVGMDIAAVLVYRTRFDENLNGTDFVPYFFERSPERLRVFLLGGKPEIVLRAADHVRRVLGQEVLGVRDGYGGLRDVGDPELVESIECSGAQVVLVALGNPLQEEWILRNRDALSAPVLIGVGALFDFWAGGKPRAPAAIRRLRLEWLYRLCLEPRRLARRYTVDVVRFLFVCYRER